MTKPDLRPYYWHLNNTRCDTWFERDRACVRLLDSQGNEIICLWDDAVGQFVVDGFKRSNESWHQALCTYATEHKLRAKYV